jgi:hypothetical protein
VQVTFVVIEHEVFSTVIRTVPLLWYVQKIQFLAKVEATDTGKLLDSLSVKTTTTPTPLLSISAVR